MIWNGNNDRKSNHCSATTGNGNGKVSTLMSAERDDYSLYEFVCLRSFRSEVNEIIQRYLGNGIS